MNIEDKKKLVLTLLDEVDLKTYEDALDDIINTALDCGDAFLCCDCERETENSLLATGYKDLCLYCEENRDISRSDEESYKEAKGIK